MPKAVCGADQSNTVRGHRYGLGMGKPRRVFVCTACGAEAPAWTGRCQSCDGWATVEEQASVSGARKSSADLVSLEEFVGGGSVPVPTGVDEVDRALGGGLVPGSVTLISGEPGIGKSTLTLQLGSSVASSGPSVVLVTGEEAPVQIAARATRLGPLPPTLSVHDSTEVESVVLMMATERPQLVVVDSIQTLRVSTVEAAVGSVTQLREAASRLVAAAKSHGVSVLIVGHVTKEGGLAGPRALEHVVDTVLSFVGDRSSSLRFLRADKHRFGPTTEVGLFEMTSTGLVAVADPSRRFLADRAQSAAGSVVVPVLEGQRPVMVEVQALVASAGDGHPQRTAQGIAPSRLKLVLAVLEQRAGIPLADQDVFASIAGGVRSDDPASDLGLALALSSARKDAALGDDLVACGEIGLTGELRSPGRLEHRLQEAFRLGFRRAIVPESAPVAPTGLELLRCGTLQQAIAAAKVDRSLSASAVG